MWTHINFLFVPVNFHTPFPQKVKHYILFETSPEMLMRKHNRCTVHQPLWLLSHCNMPHGLSTLKLSVHLMNGKWIVSLPPDKFELIQRKRKQAGCDWHLILLLCFQKLVNFSESTEANERGIALAEMCKCFLSRAPDPWQTFVPRRHKKRRRVRVLHSQVSGCNRFPLRHTCWSNLITTARLSSVETIPRNPNLQATFRTTSQMAQSLFSATGCYICRPSWSSYQQQIRRRRYLN